LVVGHRFAEKRIKIRQGSTSLPPLTFFHFSRGKVSASGAEEFLRDKRQGRHENSATVPILILSLGKWSFKSSFMKKDINL
jgi:hypothetical protein